MRLPRTNTQKAKVLQFLQAGNRITPLHALHHFGVFRLAAIICNLRREGYDIDTIMVENGNGAKYASYKLNLDLPF